MTEQLTRKPVVHRWYTRPVLFVADVNRALSAIAAFRSELARYRTAKGSVQFPIDEPMPLELIAQIVRFRA